MFVLPETVRGKQGGEAGWGKGEKKMTNEAWGLCKRRARENPQERLTYDPPPVRVVKFVVTRREEKKARGKRSGSLARGSKERSEGSHKDTRKNDQTPRRKDYSQKTQNSKTFQSEGA